jgi:hypothetical protein
VFVDFARSVLPVLNFDNERSIRGGDGRLFRRKLNADFAELKDSSQVHLS